MKNLFPAYEWEKDSSFCFEQCKPLFVFSTIPFKNTYFL